MIQRGWPEQRCRGGMVKDIAQDSLAYIKGSSESVWERSLESQVGGLSTKSFEYQA